MKIEEIHTRLAARLQESDCVLVGLGAEWKTGDTEREAAVEKAAKVLRGMLDGRDHFVIGTISKEELLRLGFAESHIVAPLDVSLTEEEWNAYTYWLARTLNRKLTLLELGEGFWHPSLIRWPFEKTTLINKKAYLYRIHKTLYQITDELDGKAEGIAMDSVDFCSSCIPCSSKSS